MVGQVLQGVVAWDVEVKNQNDELCAVYTILTLVQRRADATDPELIASQTPGKMVEIDGNASQ